ncbi:DUF1365 domain-containing protein [Flocculibacter collagenilyticus]|uniref:DUF1365 domain-containing protein n=1 Tax=Flocculibacter collagenilyticus TaxID=2744479 RepID=UPI0018F2E674|nr:DUF1365 domain-containing protein [Flocculibacter collagenilyticus]
MSEVHVFNPAHANALCQATGFWSGNVVHFRTAPKVHKFRYPYFCVWLNLDDLAQARKERPEWFSKGIGVAKFKRKHYFGAENADDSSLAEYVRRVAIAEYSKHSEHIDKTMLAKFDTENQVWFLGQLSYFGCYFSPVNFYFIGKQGEFHTLVAEVSNTPWGEKHSYVIPLNRYCSPALEERAGHSFSEYGNEKMFHVSPFMSMQQAYSWQISTQPHAIKVVISNSENTQKIFHAALHLTPKPLNQNTLKRVIFNTAGWMFSTKLKIYWQALKLFMKGIPFHAHAKKGSTRSS